MSDNIERLQHQVATAAELHSVVRTMKALAAAALGQYENAVTSLLEYNRSVEWALSEWFRQLRVPPPIDPQKPGSAPAAIILFGSDQGLVGQFNASLLDYYIAKMPAIGEKSVWVVGERLDAECDRIGLHPDLHYEVPVSLNGITPLVNRLLTEMESRRNAGNIGDVYVLHNRPAGRTGYEPVIQRLLPLAEAWKEAIANIHWPRHQRPELIGGPRAAGIALIGEFLFVSLYKTCTESLAAENAARLAAMEHAEKNIEQLSGEWTNTFHRLRQQEIDEELFDIIAGSEALIISGPHTQIPPPPPAPAHSAHRSV